MALSTSTSGGYYNFGYTPTASGNQSFRVFFTGVPTGFVNGTATPLSGLTVPGPSFVEGYTPPQAPGNGNPARNATDTQYSTVTSLTVGNSGDVFSQLATGLNAAFTSLAKSTSNAISAVNTNVGNINTQLSSLSSSSAKQSDLTALQTQVTNLNNQVSTLTTIAYAALAVAVVLGLIAILLSRRKPSS